MRAYSSPEDYQCHSNNSHQVQQQQHFSTTSLNQQHHSHLHQLHFVDGYRTTTTPLTTTTTTSGGGGVANDSNSSSVQSLRMMSRKSSTSHSSPNEDQPTVGSCKNMFSCDAYGPAQQQTTVQVVVFKFIPNKFRCARPNRK
jgi:hypothetical protein